MQLVFIRHGDPDYSIDGLTEEGKKQVAALSEYLKNESFDGVYSSPLGRAHLTAQACFSDSEIVIKNWLKEFCYNDEDVLNKDMYKDYIGKTALKDGRQLNGKSLPYYNWDFYPSFFCNQDSFYDNDAYLDTPVMESTNQKNLYNNVVTNFDKILEENGYKREGRYYRATSSNRKKLVFFCHLGVMSVLMSHLMNIPYILIAQTTCVSPSSITRFVTEEREQSFAQFRCLALGETPHLALKGIKPSFAARFCETFDSDERH